VVINNWDPIGLPALPKVMIRETGGSTAVTEGGATDTYQVLLGRTLKDQSTADVTLPSTACALLQEISSSESGTTPQTLLPDARFSH